MANNQTPAERQRRRRERLKAEGVEEVLLPLDKETRATLDRLLLARGYQPHQKNRLRGAAHIVGEALTNLEHQDQEGETPAGQGVVNSDSEEASRKRIQTTTLPGGGYQVAVDGSDAGKLHKVSGGWRGTTPEGQQVTGQTLNAAARRLAEAAGLPYPE